MKQAEKDSKIKLIDIRKKNKFDVNDINRRENPYLKKPMPVNWDEQVFLDQIKLELQ